MKKEHVQNAKEQKPKSEPSPVAGENVVQEQTQTSDAANAVPTVDKILENIDPKKLQLANEMGIPLQDLLLWAKNVETQQKVIIEVLKQLPTEEGIAEKLRDKLLETQQKQRAEMAEKMKNVPAGGSGVGLGEILSLLGSGGGGGDDEFTKAVKATALENMSLGNVFLKAVVIKMVPELADQLIPKAKVT